MKKILIGNKYLGYKPIDEFISNYSRDCPVHISPNDIIEWASEAKHGEIFELKYNKGNLICMEK